MNCGRVSSWLLVGLAIFVVLGHICAAPIHAHAGAVTTHSEDHSEGGSDEAVHAGSCEALRADFGLHAPAAGFATVVLYVQVPPAAAVPAFARQYDLQCNACHTRPPRLNRFGEQFHMMGFQIPSASRPDGLLGSLKEDGPAKALIDSLALRVEIGRASCRERV